MRKSASLVAAFGGMLVLLSHAAPAQAAPRTWVSASGSDLTICSREAPCQHYAAAYDQTDPGGEINCVDPGDFGTLIISKSISIVCDYTEGGVLAVSTHGFHINAPAGSVITLKGQDIRCIGAGIHGILMNNAGVALHLHNVRIRNCTASGSGIAVFNSSGVATVLVADSHISDSGSSISDAAILVGPITGGSANVSVVRSHLERNINGIFANNAGGSAGASNISVLDSFISGSPNVGIVVVSASAAFTASVDNTLINLSANVGAAVSGASATLRIGGSTITQNVTGVANFGGTVQSFKDNVIAGNGTDGTPVTAFPGPGGALQ